MNALSLTRRVPLVAVWLALFVSVAAEAKPTKLQGVVNLNTASTSQLELLPGVGESTAARIVAYRQKQPFRRVEELVRVKGFGKKRFAKLKPYLAISGDTTLALQQESAAVQPAGQQKGGGVPSS